MGKPVKPTFRARLLGRTLRQLREQAGLTQNEACGKLRFTDSKLSRIEQGQVPGYHEFRAMLDVCGVVVSEWDTYLEMFDRAKQKGWWHAYGLSARGFVSMEDEASTVRSFEPGYIPGLLQTEAYMREVFAAERRPLEGDKLENAVAVRMRRQWRLEQEPVLELHVVIDESVLRRAGCDIGAHREQLHVIAARAALPNVTVQVVPGFVGPHPGQAGNLTILSFPHKDERDVAYIEHILGAVHVEKESEVSVAKLAFDDLADRALDEQDSLALIERAEQEASDAHNGYDRLAVAQQQL